MRDLRSGGSGTGPECNPICCEGRQGAGRRHERRRRAGASSLLSGKAPHEQALADRSRQGSAGLAALSRHRDGRDVRGRPGRQRPLAGAVGRKGGRSERRDRPGGRVTGQLTFAFIAGTVASVNPCGFALLPAYVARQLTLGSEPSYRSSAVARALAVGALTTVGFLLVFGSLGTAITLGLHSLTRVVPWLALAIGVLLVIGGIAVLSGRRVGLTSFSRVRPTAGVGYRSVVLFGLGYGVASLSCALPIFLVVAGTAVTGSVLAAPLTFAAYALGMGTILTALAV